MMKKTALIGLMLIVGALSLTIVDAQDLNGCALVDDIHYYHPPGDFTIWESKKDHLLIHGGPFVLAGRVVDLCMGPGVTDFDYETGWGSARLQVAVSGLDANGNPCSPTPPHHNIKFYVYDFAFPRDVDPVSGWSGADGEPPCGSGIIGDTPADCLAHFWGKGPHVACGIGPDGTYWVFLDAVGFDLNEPSLSATTSGCIWTTNFGGKGVKALC